ncbi:MAG: hypothetical protein ACSLE6_09965 [Mycobacterium sp.]
MTVFGERLRQRDRVTCGPSAAIMAGALLDPSYGAQLNSGDDQARQWFADEQARLHRALNRVWPRRLGTTPAGMARAISRHSSRYGARYRWRPFLGRRDSLSDVRSAVESGWPVAMLVGSYVPRHWVLLVGIAGETFHCYEPSSGEIRPADCTSIRAASLRGLGFARPFAFVLPKRPPTADG